MQEPRADKNEQKYSKKQLKLLQRDERGIQTFFRTLSKNHYTLLEMIDRKASIILTINSIIISLLLAAAVLSGDQNPSYLKLISTVMINCCILSMLFALLAIRPHRYKLDTNSSLDTDGILYAGALRNENIDSYQKRINSLINNGREMYNSMIRDLFLIGISIRDRQRLVFISIGTFVLGLMFSMFMQIWNVF